MDLIQALKSLFCLKRLNAYGSICVFGVRVLESYQVMHVASPVHSALLILDVRSAKYLESQNE